MYQCENDGAYVSPRLPCMRGSAGLRLCIISVIFLFSWVPLDKYPDIKERTGNQLLYCSQVATSIQDSCCLYKKRTDASRSCERDASVLACFSDIICKNSSNHASSMTHINIYQPMPIVKLSGGLELGRMLTELWSLTSS